MRCSRDKPQSTRKSCTPAASRLPRPPSSQPQNEVCICNDEKQTISQCSDCWLDIGIVTWSWWWWSSFTLTLSSAPVSTIGQLGGTVVEETIYNSSWSSFSLLSLTSCRLMSTLVHVHTSRRSVPPPRPQQPHLTFSPRLPHAAFPFLHSPPETRASQPSLAS